MDVRVAVLQGVRRPREGDEVRRHEPGALVDELVEGVLPVGAGLAPEHLAGVVADGGAVPAHALAVGLHRELLEVGREPVQQLRVGEDGVGVGAEEVGVPDVEQAHLERHVGRCGSGAEVLVHGVEAGQQVGEVVGTDGDDQRQADGRVHRVATADPVPEAERVVGVDAELGDLVERGRDRHEVLRDRVARVAARRAGAPAARPCRAGRWSASPASRTSCWTR